MTIAQTSNVESVREALNRLDVSAIADAFRGVALGDVLRGLPVYLRGVAPNNSGTPQNVSTEGVVQLPEDAKAAFIFRCTVKASGVADGEFTIEPYGTTPATTEVAVAPNGDIVFLASDAVTSADIIYLPQKGDVLGNNQYSKLGVTSLTLSVLSTGQALLPAPYAGLAVLLMQANVTAAGTGGVTGQKQILVPASAATAAGTAALSKDGKSIWLNHTTDLPTQVVVDVLVASGLVSTAQLPNGGQVSPAGVAVTTDINAILEAANNGQPPNAGSYT
jgi:hypothetical protein